MQEQQTFRATGLQRGGEGTLWRLCMTGLFLAAAALSIWATDPGATPVADLAAIVGLPEA